MLEKMDEFFNNRTDGYEEHQLNEIEYAKEFYPFTARQLPTDKDAQILDLGCGTGLELGFYFEINPTANIVGIDLAEDMLKLLKEKFKHKKLTAIRGSYFEIHFEKNHFDAVVSVESLHHFTKEEKIPLYTKVYNTLKENGYFLLTDYFAPSDVEEKLYRNKLLKFKEEQGIKDNEFYHYDTPLTVEHETEALKAAGFTKIEILGKWDNTYTVKASKC